MVFPIVQTILMLPVVTTPQRNNASE